jgi:hypothetical protein
MEKKKILNSSDLNNYYNMVNDKLKKFSEFNIPVNKIVSYLKPGTENFNNFINNDKELSQVEGIENVLRDVIMDMYYAFKDGFYNKKKLDVKKFENLLIENVFNISDITSNDKIEHDKVLCDYFKTSLSNIQLAKKDIHLYKINYFGDTKNIIIFNTEEINAIKKNLIIKLTNDVKLKHFDILNKNVFLNEITEDDIINQVLNSKITVEDVLKYIADNIGFNIEVSYSDRTELKNKEYYLFTVIEGDNKTSLF